MAKSSSPALDPRAPSEHIPLLLQLAEIANSSLDLDQLLERIAGLIRQLVDCEIMAILLLDEATGELKVRHAVGHSSDLVSSLRIPIGKGLTGIAAFERRPVLVNDVRSDGRYLAGPPDVRSELAVPLVVRNRVVGVIDLQSIQPGYFTERHRELLELAAARLAAAIQNARLYRSTLRQARILATLTEIGREFSSILQLDELLRKVAELLHQLIRYDGLFVLLLDERRKVLKDYLSVRFRKEVDEKSDIPVGQGIVGHAVAERRAILVPDVRQDPRYIACNLKMRSELAVPLVVKDRVIGVIDMESTRRGFFTPRHQSMMEMLAPQVAIAIENARLYEQLAREEARMERDLSAARELQTSLFPRACPQYPGFELCAKYEPARELGGDLYDYIEYEPQAGSGRALGIFAGDVSGKGTAAALYAALGHGLIRTVAARRQPAGQLLGKLNKVLCERRVEARSLALCFALLDMEQRTLEIANGGLPHPIFCRRDQIMPVKVEGVPLGLLPNIEYQSTLLELQPDDIAVFYSDGISENFNPGHEEFGRRRLRELIRANCAGSATSLLDAIFAAADQWSAGLPPSDDRTVVILKMSADGQPQVERCG